MRPREFCKSEIFAQHKFSKRRATKAAARSIRALAAATVIIKTQTRESIITSRKRKITYTIFEYKRTVMSLIFYHLKHIARTPAYQPLAGFFVQSRSLDGRIICSCHNYHPRTIYPTLDQRQQKHSANPDN